MHMTSNRWLKLRCLSGAWHGLIGLVGLLALAVSAVLDPPTVIGGPQLTVLELIRPMVEGYGVPVVIVPVILALIVGHRNGLITIIASVCALSVPILGDAWGVVNLGYYILFGVPWQLAFIGAVTVIRWLRRRPRPGATEPVHQPE